MEKIFKLPISKSFSVKYNIISEQNNPFYYNKYKFIIYNNFIY